MMLQEVSTDTESAASSLLQDKGLKIKCLNAATARDTESGENFCFHLQLSVCWCGEEM